MRILYPPHPMSRIPPHRLPEYEASGEWVAQRKFNGTRVLVHISPSGEVGMLNRHGSPPARFSMGESHKHQILGLGIREGLEYWFDGELLDHKTRDPRYKGKIVLFDVLQAGKYLIREPGQDERLGMLSEICRHPKVAEPAMGIALEVSPDVWMAESWDSGFADRFGDFIQMDEIEGLVLRKKSSVLGSFGQKKYEVPWIVRCRKPNSGGSYNF